jgi:hypothetical protein
LLDMISKPLSDLTSKEIFFCQTCWVSGCLCDSNAQPFVYWPNALIARLLAALFVLLPPPPTQPPSALCVFYLYGECRLLHSLPILLFNCVLCYYAFWFGSIPQGILFNQIVKWPNLLCELSLQTIKLQTI